MTAISHCGCKLHSTPEESRSMIWKPTTTSPHIYHSTQPLKHLRDIPLPAMITVAGHVGTSHATHAHKLTPSTNPGLGTRNLSHLRQFNISKMIVTRNRRFNSSLFFLFFCPSPNIRLRQPTPHQSCPLPRCCPTQTCVQLHEMHSVEDRGILLFF